MEKRTRILKNLLWVFKQVFSYDKKYIVIMFFSMLVTGIVPPISTLVSQSIINGVQTREGLNKVIFFVIIYVSIDLLVGVFNYILNYYKTKFSQGFVLKFKQLILNKASKLSLSSYENSETYDMINRAQYEGNQNLVTYLETFMKIFSSIITMVSYLAILLTFNPYIVLCIIIVPFIKFLISKKINIMSFNLLKSRTNDSRKCWYLEYLITHGDFYKELKTYGLFDYFIKKFKTFQELFNNQDLKLAKKSTLLLSIMTIFELLIDGILFTYVVFCGYVGKILIGNVLTYMKTITQVKEQMTSILQTLSGMSKDSLFIDQLIKYFNLPVTKEDGKIRIESIENIVISHLYYRYKSEQEYVLKDINLDIKIGERIAIVGQNGSGKTTLIKILMGFYENYEGDIYINNINLHDINKKFYQKRIATLFQDFVKYEATYRENIAYGNLSYIKNEEKLKEITEKFGISELINKSKQGFDSQIGCWFDEGSQISIGQWQKVALCRAFIKNGDVYILDEPNAALDAIAEYELSNSYNEILKDKIGIIVAHKFNNFIKDVHKIIILDKGKIMGIGNHDTLVNTNSIYKDLYTIQNGLLKKEK